jgi:benzoyl-CoA reductase/2-hydroxyglutaryl-CoA dehydratase subunit BcrC/BadD/HgdB
VFTTACDQLRRAADAASATKGERVFLFNLPATWQSPAARRLYHDEVARLGRFLTRLGGRPPSDAVLRAAIRDADERRAQARAILGHASARQAMEALAWTHSGETCSSEPEHTPPIRTPVLLPAETAGSPKRFGLREALAPSPGDRVDNARGISLALIGGPLTTADWPLLDRLEEAGGWVAVHAAEPGERTLLPALGPVAEASDPQTALADHYFDHLVDVFPRPNDRLYEWLGPRLAERRVRGLLLWAHVGCDLWRAEAASLREAFGLPLLLVEAHTAGGVTTRDLNRLQAFIESLQ